MYQFLVNHWQEISAIGFGISEILGLTKHGGLLASILRLLFKPKNQDHETK